jgi:putative Holliday junction resolvase
MPPTTPKIIVALDVGHKRVGVAIANDVAKLPAPLTTLERGEQFWQLLGDLLSKQSAGMVVVGLPRNLDGGDTAQTAAARDFATELQQQFGLPITLQDEALTSVKAREELQARGKPFARGDVDALAAAYILEDYLHGL